MRRFTIVTFVLILLLSLVFNTIPGRAAPAAADRGVWAPNVAYAVNDTVTYNGQTYQCIQAHTSLTGWEPPNVAALWKLIASGSTNTPTSIATATKTSTPVNTATKTNTPINTATKTNTPAVTATKTNTPVNTPTKTNTPANTATKTNTPAPTATLGSGVTCWAAWSSAQIYTLGMQASDNNQNYQANWWNQSDRPSTSTSGAWTAKGACVSGPTATPGGPTATPTAGGIPSLAQAKAREADLTNNDFFRKVKASIRTLDNAAVEAVSPGNANNPANVKRVEALVPLSKWNYYFSVAHSSYTYTRFLQAVAKFPAFCGDYTDGRNADLICRRSLATMFAHFTQETGGHSSQYSVPEWRQGLVYVREIGCTDTGSACGYNAECADPVFNVVWTCGKDATGAFLKYYGRGAKQLSYNYNYGPFSQVMFNGDQRVLLNNPDMVAESWLNLSSAVFFFVFPQPPKPSMLHVVDGTWVPNSVDTSLGLGNNFPTTIQIINAECQDATTKPAAQNRIDYYKQFATDLGWNYNQESMSCTSMGRFSSGSSAAYNIYWEKNWSVGGEYQCQLVSYQTPYNALIENQYVKCVEANWNVTLK